LVAMKVLLPTEYYPPFAMGGAEISAKLLAEGLADLGIEMHVLTPNYGSAPEGSSKEGGVLVHRFKSPRKLLFKGRRASHETYARQRAIYHLMISRYIRLSAREFSKRISGFHSKEAFGIIHAQNVESVFGLNLAEVGCPKIAHLRGLQYFCIDGSKQVGGSDCEKCSVQGIENCLRTNRFNATLIRRELGWRRAHIGGFDHYVTVSEYIAREAGREGLPPERISALHNPVDEDQISSLSKKAAREKLGWNFENIVLYVGGLTETKGIKLLPEVARRVPEMDFVVVGGGPLASWLVEVQKSVDNLHYAGQFPPEEVKHCYRAADVLFVPSIWQEPYPRVVIEGQANQACVLAFAVGGIPEAIEHGKTGFLVNRGDVEGSVSVLQQLLGDRDMVKRVGSLAEKKVREENMKGKFAKKVLSIYRSLLGEQK